MTVNGRGVENASSGEASQVEQKGESQDSLAGKSDFKRRKLSPVFVDDIRNISISPNGACRLHFSTWNTDEEDEPVRVDSEVIMTVQSLKVLAEALPQALKASVDVLD